MTLSKNIARQTVRNALCIGAAALLLASSAGLNQSSAQEVRVHRNGNAQAPSGATRVYGAEYRAYGYETDRYDRRNDYPVNGGLAGGNSGVRSLDTSERVRAFFNDLDRTGYGGGD